MWFKASLAITIWISIWLLVGCRVALVINPVNTVTVSKMTAMESGYQTLKARNLLTASAIVTDSRYVYENSYNSDIIAIAFLDHTGSMLSSDPKITDLVDINSKYAAINFAEISIDLNGQKVTGQLTLILEKNSGLLFPLVENGKAIYQESSSWNTWSHFSNVADLPDNNRIYLHRGSQSSLHVAQLIEDKFVISRVFDDSLRDYWVLHNGDIISQAWGSNTLSWIYSFPDASLPAYTIPPGYKLFMIDGGLYDTNGLDVKQYVRQGQGLVRLKTAWVSNAYKVPANSVKRNGYEMQADCSLYYFNLHSQEIEPLMSAQMHSGTHSSAGNESLFCLYSDSSDDLALPRFMLFNTLAESAFTMDVGFGTKLDADRRLVIVNDNELMFYESPTASFNEYYINIADNTERTLMNSSGQVSIIKMLTFEVR